MSSTTVLSRFRGSMPKTGSGRDLGLWPVIGALVIIAVGFQAANGAYLTPRNLSNLTLQTATLAVLTLGVMLVLVLGEIDLSIGAVSGLAASAMAMLSALAGWPAIAAIAAALALGTLIGLAQGMWIVRFGAPSFIVTLAGMLVWQGVQLFVLTPQSGQVLVQDDAITNIASSYLPIGVGWALAAVIAVMGAGWVVGSRVLTARSGYHLDPLARDVFRIVLIVVVPVVAVLLLNPYLGVPVLLVIMLACAACSRWSPARRSSAGTSTPWAAMRRRPAERGSASARSSSSSPWSPRWRRSPGSSTPPASSPSP